MAKQIRHGNSAREQRVEARATLKEVIHIREHARFRVSTFHRDERGLDREWLRE